MLRLVHSIWHRTHKYRRAIISQYGINTMTICHSICFIIETIDATDTMQCLPFDFGYEQTIDYD